MDCDLVVLGAAGSGLVAAVKAADVSGRKVIVLEKAKKPGGGSVFAGGMGEVGQIKDSKWQRDAGMPVSDPPDIKGQFWDWVVSKGGAEKYFVVEKEGSGRTAGGISMPGRMEKYKGLTDPSIGPGKMGSYMVDKMVECCEKMGIPILTETRAKKFVTDDKGRVIGVEAETKEGQLIVNCKACVIAAGGFGGNYEKLRKHWPEVFNNKHMFSLCPHTITGDCIDMAEEIGAAIDQAKRELYFPGGFIGVSPFHHPYSYALQNLMSNAMMVCINLNGKRWRKEGWTALAFGPEDAPSLGDQPGAVCYCVTDSDIIEQAGEGLSKDGFLMSGTEETACAKRWREELEYEAAIDDEGAGGNHTKKADTLVELALKMDVDPATFVATIERYNRFCETGNDPDFGKSAQSLKPVRRPPFYAIFGHRWSQCTKGRNGIAVNSNFEVVNKKGEAMPGLWAAGDGCTIFGGLVLNKSMPAFFGAGAAAAKNTADPATTVAPPGNASIAPGTAGRTAMTAAMKSGGATKNILEGEGSPCGGLGAALISGYYAGANAGNYIK